MPRLILATFSGIGLLDRAFEREWPDACLLRAPERLWGGDIAGWHAPAGVFEGVIGGPPCPSHSRLRAAVANNGHAVEGDLIPEFERICAEAGPTWWLMENVPLAPTPRVEGYVVRELVLDNRGVPEEPGGLYGPIQHRVRRFSFGTRDGRRLAVEAALLEHPEWAPAVCGSGVTLGPRRAGKRIRLSSMGYKTREALAEANRLQGLPPDFLADAPFTVAEKVRVVGNGVPLPLGRAIARAVRRACPDPD